MKRWLIDTFLPMWAKETVLCDNRALARKVKALEQENKILTSYIRGLEKGVRAARGEYASSRRSCAGHCNRPMDD